jgi:hypothetical protein
LAWRGSFHVLLTTFSKTSMEKRIARKRNPIGHKHEERARDEHRNGKVV